MPKNGSPFLQTPIEPFVVEGGLTVEQLLARMERISFQGRNLATAYRIWHRATAAPGSGSPDGVPGV
jgi:hypothetical protein